MPDGPPFVRRPMVIPAATNGAAELPVVLFLKKWLADNVRAFPDAADNDFEDWFEIDNPGTKPWTSAANP